MYNYDNKGNGNLFTYHFTRYHLIDFSLFSATDTLAKA